MLYSNYDNNDVPTLQRKNGSIVTDTESIERTEGILEWFCKFKRIVLFYVPTNFVDDSAPDVF